MIAPVDHVRAVLATAAAGRPLDGADGRHVDRYRVAAQREMVDRGAITTTGQITDLGQRLLTILGG